MSTAEGVHNVLARLENYAVLLEQGLRVLSRVASERASSSSRSDFQLP